MPDNAPPPEPAPPAAAACDRAHQPTPAAGFCPGRAKEEALTLLAHVQQIHAFQEVRGQPEPPQTWNELAPVLKDREDLDSCLCLQRPSSCLLGWRRPWRICLTSTRALYDQQELTEAWGPGGQGHTLQSAC